MNFFLKMKVKVEISPSKNVDLSLPVVGNKEDFKERQFPALVLNPALLKTTLFSHRGLVGRNVICKVAMLQF